MTSRLRAALSALLAVTALAGLTGCGGALKKPTVEVAEVRVADFDRESAQFTVTLKVTNSNSVELTVSDIQAKFTLADQEVGTAQALQPRYTLPASGTVMLPMRVKLDFKTLPAAVSKSALALVSGGLPYRLSGSVTAFNGLITVPFEKSGDIAKRR